MINPHQSYQSRLKKNELCIFLFHGVIREHVHKVQNYTRKHIDQSHFRNVLLALSSKGIALTMTEAYNHIINGREFPHYSFVLTFDDGFENNYSVAAPILDELNIPLLNIFRARSLQIYNHTVLEIPGTQ